MNASTILTRARRRVGDSDGRQIDAPLALDLLNESLEELSIRSECIVYGHYHSCIEAQGKYGLPNNFLSVKFCEFNNRGDRYFLLPDTIKKNTYLINNEIGSQPLYYTVSGQSVIERVVAPVTAVHTLVSFEIANRPDSVKIGDRIINVTNANAITNITFLDDDIIFVDEWQGNADPGIALDNQIRIVSPHASNKTLVISPPPTFTDSAGDESIFIFGACQHRQITQTDIDANNDRLEIDHELISALTNLVCMKFSEVINSIEDGMTARYEVAFETEYHRVIGGITRKIREYQSMWASGALTPVRQETAGIVDPIGHAYNLVTIA